MHVNILCFSIIIICNDLIKYGYGAACQGRYFELSTTKASYTDAQSACISGGGVLTSIPDEETNNQLITQGNGKVVDNGWTGTEITAYTGGHKMGNDFKWQDGTVFASYSGSTWSITGYADWFTDSSHKTNTPSGGGNCMVFHRYYISGSYEWKWRDQPCNAQRFYICTKPGDRILTLDKSTYSAVSGQQFRIVISISHLHIQPLDLYYKLNDGSETLITSGFTGTKYTHTLAMTPSSNSITISAESSATSCSISATSQLQQVKTTVSKISVVVNSASTQSVTCTASGYSNLHARWIRGTTQVTASSSATIYQLTSGGSQSTLYIQSNTLASDGGQYICKVTNWNGGGNTNKVLTVNVAANIKTSPPSHVFAIGSSHTFKCISYGYPTPTTLVWLSPVGSSSNIIQKAPTSSQHKIERTLSFTLQHISEAGEYTCQVSSNVAGASDQITKIQVQVAANISTSPTSHVATIGGQQIFTCTSFGYPQPQLTWLRNGITVSSSGNVNQSPQTFDSSQNKVIRKLHVTLNQRSEAGQYTCKVSSNTHGGSDQTSNIEIIVSADINVVPNSTVVVLGVKRTFTCVSNGFPLPQVTWIRNSDAVSSSGNIKQTVTSSLSTKTATLHFTLHHISEAGEYTCKVSSNVDGGSNLTKTMQVHVAANISTSPTSHVFTSATQQIFTCTSYGYPTPQITWIRNGVSVGSNGRIYQAPQAPIATYGAVKKLHVQLKQISEAGEYLCVVSNNVTNGRNQTSNIHVQVSANLSSSPTSHVFTLEKQNTFTCTFTGYPAYDIAWMRNGNQVSSLNAKNVHQTKQEKSGTTFTRKLVITLKHISEAGNYTCSTQDTSAQSILSSVVQVQVAANISTSPESQFFTYGKEKIFTCTSYGFPLPQITWYRGKETLKNLSSNTIHQQPQEDFPALNKVSRDLNVTLQNIDQTGPYTCFVSSNTEDGNNHSSSVDVSVPTDISTSPDTLVVHFGTSYVFLCTTFGFPRKIPIWYRNGVRVSTNITDRIHQVPLIKNYSVQQYVRKLNITLHHINESGKYTCKVNSNMGGGLVLHENITIQVAANVSISDSQALVYKYKDVITVECISYGFPTPTLVWYRNESSVSHNKGSPIHQSITEHGTLKVVSALSFMFTDPSQTGEYTCEASNFKGVTVNTTLTVEAAVNVSLSTKATNIEDGRGANVTCTSFGFPRPSVYWSRYGSNVSLLISDIYQTVVNASQYKASTVLVFTSAALNDSGSYTCLASQTLQNGTVIQVAESLQVYVGPIFKNATVPEEFSQSQKFTCTFIGHPTPDVKWRINGQIVKEDNLDPMQVSSNTTGNGVASTLFLQLSIIFGANATIECWSENEYGRSKAYSSHFNTDLREDNGNYFSQSNKKKNFANASQECADKGGIIPPLSFVNDSLFQDKWSTEFWNAVWISGGGDQKVNFSDVNSTACFLFEIDQLSNESCRSEHHYLCHFPGIEITETSKCYYDEVFVKWKDVNKYNGLISFSVSVHNVEKSVFVNKQVDQTSTTNYEYSASFENLPTNTNFTAVVRLFASNVSSISTARTSVLPKIVTVKQIESGKCEVIAPVPENILFPISSLQLKLTTFSKAETRITITKVTPPLSQVIELSKGEHVNATYEASSEECPNTVYNAIGTCHSDGSDSGEQNSTPGVTSQPGAAQTNVGSIVGPLVAVVLLVLLAAVIYKRQRMRSWYLTRLSTRRRRLPDKNGAVETLTAAAVVEPEPIHVDQLEDFFTDSFNREHTVLTLNFNRIKEMSKRFVSDTNDAKSFENTNKNRYKNILPYDSNRVVIKSSQNNANGYINASKIEGYHVPGKWIATQGPTENTLDDFWSMIWGENVKVIVMLANLVEKQKSKCDKYWPDEGNDQQFGSIKVFPGDVINHGCYVIRRFGLEDTSDTYTSERKELTQYHFIAWPDHGVPATSSGLIRFCVDVRDDLFCTSRATSSPAVVHCSAGAGRTGTFIGLDYLIDQMNETQTVDVYHVVYHMREQRMEMVQTVKQYIFIHKLLAEIAIFGNTDRSLNEFLSMIRQSKQSPDTNPIVLEFANFGRFFNFEEMSPITIETTDTVTYHTSSVDIKWAYTLEGYHTRDRIIVCRETRDCSGIFWKLVIERKPQIIVILQDPQDIEWWPYEMNEQFWFDNIGVTLQPVTDEQTKLTIESVYLVDRLEVEQLAFDAWNGNNTLEDPGLLFELFKLINSIRSGERVGDILILDRNGLTRSGEFCAMWNLIYRFNAEKKIDVFRALRDVKETLPDLAVEVENYMDCYHAMKSFTESCYVYEN